MNNVAGYLLDEWYRLLNGNISVPVYRTHVPADEDGNYVQLRMESETMRNNNARFVHRPVLIYEIVTRFRSAIDDGLVTEIESEIMQIIWPTPGTHALNDFTEVRRENATYITEDDGDEKYLRLAVRVAHRIAEQITS